MPVARLQSNASRQRTTGLTFEEEDRNTLKINLNPQRPGEKG